MKKKKPNPFFRILSFSFFVFLSLYIALESGYYETHVEERGVVTKENMERFEKDVQNGVDIDVNDYVNAEVKDYSNTFSDTGVYLANGVESFMSGGMVKVLDVLKSLFF